MEKGDRAHVLIAGGGVAALEASLALRALAGDRVAVELLAPEPHFWYRPLAVAEPFGLGEMRRFELSTLTADAGATFTHGTLVSVDVVRRLAYTEPGGALPYSTLLIACGTRPRPAVDGAITFRGPADTEAIEGLLTEIERGEVRRIAFVVPAGAVVGPSRIRAGADDGGLGRRRAASPVWSSPSSRRRASRCISSAARPATRCGRSWTREGSPSTRAYMRQRPVRGSSSSSATSSFPLTGLSRSRGSRAHASAASRRPSRASSTSTSTDASPGSRTSMPRATSRPFPSSRAASPPSRRRQPPRRSRPRPAST